VLLLLALAVARKSQEGKRVGAKALQKGFGFLAPMIQLQHVTNMFVVLYSLKAKWLLT
jgi:hypothetical protein